MSVSGPRNRNYGSAKFLGPETDIMGQFLGPETVIMGERYFMALSNTNLHAMKVYLASMEVNILGLILRATFTPLLH